MDEKPRGKLLSLLYTAIVPLIFTSVFCLIFIYALDIPVKQSIISWGNSVPVLRDIVPGEDDARTNTVINLQNKLDDKNKKIAELEQEVRSNQAEIKIMKKTNQQLKEQLTQKRSVEYEKQVKKVAEIYADIPASKAAAMIESLTIEEATLTISMLKQTQQSSILASIKDPKLAAKITMLLKELALINETDPDVLKEKIRELAQQQGIAQ